MAAAADICQPWQPYVRALPCASAGPGRACLGGEGADRAHPCQTCCQDLCMLARQGDKKETTVCDTLHPDVWTGMPYQRSL